MFRAFGKLAANGLDLRINNLEIGVRNVARDISIARTARRSIRQSVAVADPTQSAVLGSKEAHLFFEHRNFKLQLFAVRMHEGHFTNVDIVEHFMPTGAAKVSVATQSSQ